MCRIRDYRYCCCCCHWDVSFVLPGAAAAAAAAAFAAPFFVDAATPFTSAFARGRGGVLTPRPSLKLKLKLTLAHNSPSPGRRVGAQWRPTRSSCAADSPSRPSLTRRHKKTNSPTRHKQQQQLDPDHGLHTTLTLAQVQSNTLDSTVRTESSSGSTLNLPAALAAVPLLALSARHRRECKCERGALLLGGAPATQPLPICRLWPKRNNLRVVGRRITAIGAHLQLNLPLLIHQIYHTQILMLHSRVCSCAIGEPIDSNECNSSETPTTHCSLARRRDG